MTVTVTTQPRTVNPAITESVVSLELSLGLSEVNEPG